MHAAPLVLSLCLVPITSDDPPEWGGFRGNNGAGVTESEKLPDTLDPEETALWRTELPGGYSSPVVAGDRIFLTAAEGTKLMTLCVDRHSGAIEWKREIEYDGSHVGANSSASPSPATDGERVYVLFHHFGLIAYDMKGAEVWRKPMKPFNIPHGMATSPVVHGDKLLQLVDQDTEAYLLALDKNTGEEKWRADRPSVTHGYSTPTVYVPAAGPAQVIVSGSYQIAAYSIEDGEKLWWVNGSAWQAKAVPVIIGDLCIVNAYMVPSSELGLPKLVQSWEELLAEHDADGDGRIAREEWKDDMLQMTWFIFDLDGDDMLEERDYDYLRSTATAVGGLFAIRLGGEGDVTDTHVVWRYEDRRGLPDCPSPLVYDGLLYMIKEGGLFTAMDPATGEVVKQGRVGQPDQYFASPVGAGGRILTASQAGQLAVVKSGADWQVLSVHDLQEDVWSTPAIAGDQVIVRSQEALYCFQDLDD